MGGLIDLVLIGLVVASVLLTGISMWWEWSQRKSPAPPTAEEELLREDIDAMKDELSRLRAEVLQLTAAVNILTTQLKSAGLEPAIILPPTPAGDTASIISMSSLRRKMIRAFTTDGLNSIMFELGIDAEEIQPGPKSQRVEELLDYVVQRGRLHDLIEALKAARPRTNWY